ncbi:MAG TPA: hypothetical protein VGA23_09725, partial [Methylomirabilota bacterium]
MSWPQAGQVTALLLVRETGRHGLREEADECHVEFSCSRRLGAGQSWRSAVLATVVKIVLMTA